MHTTTLPDLPPSVARDVLATLCAALPPPVADTTEARADRDATAMAAVAALLPGNAFEALLAAQVVAANAHAMHSLRRAVAQGEPPEAARRCRAQASLMMRQMQSGLAALQRTQAARTKAEAAMQPAAMASAGWWFRDASAPRDPGQAEPPPEVRADAADHAAPDPDRATGLRANDGPRSDRAGAQPGTTLTVMTTPGGGIAAAPGGRSWGGAAGWSDGPSP
jgi:hypothetical protein